MVRISYKNQSLLLKFLLFLQLYLCCKCTNQDLEKTSLVLGLYQDPVFNHLQYAKAIKTWKQEWPNNEKTMRRRASEVEVELDEQQKLEKQALLLITDSHHR